MKTLSTKQETEREKTGQDIFWLVEIDFPAPTGTKYYSTRQFTIEGRTYEGKVTRYPSLSKVLPSGIDELGIVDSADIGIQSLPEDPNRFEKLTLQHTLEGLEVRLRYIFKDLLGSIGLSDIIDAHTYRIDDFEVSTREVRLKLVDLTLALGEREVGRAITSEEAIFRLAPPESFGKIMPIIFGKCRDCRLIPVNIGQETRLHGSLSPDDVVIKVEDIANFPDPKANWRKLQIDDEIIHYNYLDAAANEFGSGSSPCKRGQDDTVAREHSDTSVVKEIMDSYHYLVAGHRCKLIDNVRIAGRLISNYSIHWWQVAGKDVQLLQINGLPTYQDVMPISTFLEVSGEKDKEGQSVWTWTTGGSNTATDAGFAYDVEGIFSFAQITKDNPLLHIKMESSLADGAAKYGDLVNVRLGIEYYESQPHDEANPPSAKLKRNGAFQNLRENIFDYVNLRRTAEQETEADNPDHPHDTKVDIGDLALPTVRLRKRAIVYGQEEVHVPSRPSESSFVRVKSWPSGESALSGSSFSLPHSLPLSGYAAGYETEIYRQIAQHSYSLWFEFVDVPYTNEQATIKKITVTVTAGHAPYPLKGFIQKKGFHINVRAAGDTSYGPSVAEDVYGTRIGGGVISLVSGDYRVAQEEALSDWEARKQIQIFTFNMDIPTNGWDYFRNIQWGLQATRANCPELGDPYVLDSFIFRMYGIEVEIEYELVDGFDLDIEVLPFRNLIGEIASNRAVQKINITKCVENNGGWGFFNETPEVFIDFNSTGSEVKIYILNVFFEFEYRAKTMRIGTGRVTADVEGHYSGSTLYENPASLIWFLLTHVDFMGLSGDYLDVDSFVAAQAELTNRGYKFARRIGDRIQIRELLAEAVWQCRCRLYFEGGKYRLKFRPLGPAGLFSPGLSVFTFDKTNMLEPILTKMRSHTTELANQITINYDENNNGDGFLRSHQVSDPSSVDRSWGERPVTKYARWHAHKNSTVIADLAAFLVQLLSYKHNFVMVDTPLLCSHLERCDVVTIDHPESELNNIPGEIIHTSRIAPHRLQFMIDTIGAHMYAYWYDGNNYILISPGRTMMYFVVEGELLGTLDWQGNLTLRGSYEQNQKSKVTNFTEPVKYIPAPDPGLPLGFHHVLAFNMKRSPTYGWAMLWFHGKTWNDPEKRRLTIASKVKTNHPLTATATDFITNSEDQWIRFAVDGTNVVAEYNHTDKTFYLKGGLQTNAIL